MSTPNNRKRKTEIFKWNKEICNYFNKEVKYYQSFTKGEQTYNVGDFVFYYKNDRSDNKEVCQLMQLFETKESSSCQGRVQKYRYGREMNKHFNISFDDDNEIIKDLDCQNELIDLNNVIGKCNVVIGTEDDSVKEAIINENLSLKDFVLCRYQVSESKIVPLLGSTLANNIEIEFVSDPKIENCTPVYKTNPVNYSTPKKHQNEIEFVNMDGDDLHVSDQIKSVKKNLTDSFGSSSSSGNNSILNYSVVSSETKPLQLKLRVSHLQPPKNPVVVLKRLDTNLCKQDDVKALRRILNNLEIDSKDKKNNKKAPTVSPRKLRRISSYYGELSTESESEKVPTRQSIRLKSKIDKRRGIQRNNFQNGYSSESDDERISKRKTKLNVNSTNSDKENTDESDTEGAKITRNIRNFDRRKSLRNCTGLNSPSVIKCNKANDSSISDRRKSLRGVKINFAELNTFIDTSDSDKEKADKKSSRSKLTSTPSKRKIDTPTSRRMSCSTPKKTPRMSVSKMMKEGTLTPTIESRKQKVVKVSTPLGLARNNLHVSYLPTHLPCREKEYNNIYNFVEKNLLDQCGGCMYISGVPGTGKTATVTMVINNLQELAKRKKITNFNFVSVNGMRLTEPRQCYVEILKQLNGKRVSWEQALSSLEKKFSTKSSGKMIPTVLLIDELDILCTKRQDVVYNLLNWPTKANGQLIVITIANTMDLPERLLISRVTSRLGLTRLTFQPYTYQQLQEIVVNRLTGNSSFSSDAIQFVARKVASISGDARRALDICRRSAEIAELENVISKVSMKHVNEAIDAMITQPKVLAIKHCSRLEKIMLQAVVAEVERTGVEETTFEYVYRMLPSLTSIEGFKMVSSTVAAAAIYRLGSCKLLLTDSKNADLKRKIILNVSSDDVYYALRND